MAEQFEVRYQLVFFSTVVLLVLLERVRGFQRQPVQMARRWSSNIGLFLIGSVVTALVIPVGIYAFALHQPPGLLARLSLPFVAQLLLTFLLIDFWRYWEHRLFHRVPVLWRLHLVHHSDTQIDVTSSERHHPLEFLLGTAVMLALIGVLGLPAQAVGLYLLTATVIALYSHANLRLPASLECRLNRLIVTPGVHAVHHSDLQAQTDSNYGTVLTLWDRLFGSYVDPAHVKIPHFGLGYFHQPRDTGLARVLQQPFLFHPRLAYPDRDNMDSQAASIAAVLAEPSGSVMTQGWKDALWGGMLGCLLAALALWPTLLDLVASWRNGEAYQYAWLVIPMLVYVLGWHHPQIGLVVSPQPDFTGVLVTVGAAACWGAAALMNIDVGRQFALVLTVQGIAMSMLGWRAYWRLFPALALMFLMIPSGDLLQPLLRLLTVKAIELFALVAHLPHTVVGFVVYVGANRYIVVDECAGLSYVTLAIFLGYSFGLLLYRSVFKIAALSLLGALLGIFANALRVNTIVLIDWVRGSQMELTAHGNIQWIALFLTLGLLFYVLSQLKADTAVVAPVIPPQDQVGPVRRFAPVVAGLSVLLITGTVVNLPTNAPRSPREAQTGLYPQNISGWELVSPIAAWSVDPQSNNETLTLTYQRNGQEMHVVIVETLSPAAKLQESRLISGDKSIWRERRVQKQTSCVASDCLTLLHTTWQRDRSRELRHVFYAYSIDNFITDSRFALRAAHGWHRLTGSRSNPRLIGLAFDDAPPAIDDLAAAFRMLQSALEAGNS
ncbi:archaeosortase/exosortase family protein [Polaromonas sp. UC242_47]|uniref:archaeosortase/exosortase family protein n=1 Tax=Polaromonas sp. UC242_47 TaxID=3374626 RepID=UPI0037AB4348